MNAVDVKRIAIKAQDDGYDHIVDHYYKKVIRAAKVGAMDISISITPWYNVEEKHVQFFINRNFKVELDAKEKLLYISWGVGF